MKSLESLVSWYFTYSRIIVGKYPILDRVSRERKFFLRTFFPRLLNFHRKFVVEKFLSVRGTVKTYIFIFTNVCLCETFFSFFVFLFFSLRFANRYLQQISKRIACHLFVAKLFTSVCLIIIVVVDESRAHTMNFNEKFIPNGSRFQFFSRKRESERETNFSLLQWSSFLVV